MAPEARAAHLAAGSFLILCSSRFDFASFCAAIHRIGVSGLWYFSCFAIDFLGKIHSLAASLLTPGASTVGFGGYLGNSKIDTSSSSVDGGAPFSVCFCIIYN